MADSKLPSPSVYDNGALMDQARRNYAATVRHKTKRDLNNIVEIMEGKWDHFAAIKAEVAKIWLAGAPKNDRASVEREIADWLIGIADHTDNEVERDLLLSLVDSMNRGEHREGLAPASIGPSFSERFPLTEDCPF